MVVAHVLAPFGALLLDSVSVGVGDAVAGMIGRFTSEYHNQRHWQESSVGYSYVAPSSFNLTTGDAAVDDLRNATFRVVARYGFEGATATRISREAKRSLTSAYRRVGSKDALLADAVAAALSSDLGFTGAENATSLPFARPDRLRRAWQATMNQIDDRNRTNRAFVLELLAAVGATASIEVPAKQWGASVQTRFRRAAEAAAPAEAESLVHLWGFRMAAGIGGLLLSFAAPRVIHRFDPLPILSANDAVCFPGSA
jgi:AcrR family transcriptional regulator